MAAEDHSVRVLKIIDGRPFSKELRVTRDYKLVSILRNQYRHQILINDLGCANGHCGFFDDDDPTHHFARVGVVIFSDVSNCYFRVAQVIGLTCMLTYSLGWGGQSEQYH